MPWRKTKDLLPQVLVDYYGLLRHYARYPGLRSTLAANLVWRDAFKGERVYVIANGPSLASFDRSEFRGRRAIVMNSFHRAEWKAEVDIVAHCIGEPRLSPAWSDPCETINGTNSASYWMLGGYLIRHGYGIMGAIWARAIAMLLLCAFSLGFAFWLTAVPGRAK